MGQSYPKVFVSSTIYDFRDLRSAFKMWLEDYGYTVLMSEFNDFPQFPSKNSYESCMAAIDQCDYFVLLIGGRVGGWYDEGNRISITRREYQYAYDRFKLGHLQLLVIVRKEVWDIREDRMALSKFLKDDASLGKVLSEENKAKLISHPSKFLTDASFIIEFIQEVARSNEMKQAAKGIGNFPRGNWIYQFGSFRDVVDICRTVFDFSGNLRHKAQRANLKHEIKSILADLLEQTSEGIRPVTGRSAAARHSFQGEPDSTSKYKGKDLILLGTFLLIHGKIGKALRSTAISEASMSGEFLDFDKASGSYIVGPLQMALLNLEAQIERLRALTPHAAWHLGMTLLNNADLHNNSDALFEWKNEQLMIPFMLHDIINGIVDSCKEIYLYIEGDHGRLLSLQMKNDLQSPSHVDKLARDRLAVADIEAWISSQSHKKT